MRIIWRYWAKAIGEKSGKDNMDSDIIAIIRTFIILIYIITNIFIVCGILRHW